jgi:transcriptional regulator with XRE-family HTH domain
MKLGQNNALSFSIIYSNLKKSYLQINDKNILYIHNRSCSSGGGIQMNDYFGLRVRRLRLERRWSQQELSLRSGISTPHISSIERGKRFPSLEYAMRLAEALGVPLTVLCDDKTEFRAPKMRNSPDELPLYLQNFVLNEAATPYLQAAHRLSTLPKEDSEFLTRMIELLSQKRQLFASMQ